MHEKGETLLIPLHLHGFTSYFTSRKATMEEYNNFTHFIVTAIESEWDPHYPSFLAQKDALLTTGGWLMERPEEFRGRLVAGMHSNPCKSLQEWGNGNLENVLTARIIVSSFGVQASNRMQPTEPTDLAAEWGIGLEAARHTLECKTQRGIWTVLHPSLSRRFR